MPGAHNIDFGAIARIMSIIFDGDIKFEIKERNCPESSRWWDLDSCNETPSLDVDKVTSLITQ